jgi:hypothetical protein
MDEQDLQKCSECEGEGEVACGWCNSGECPECNAPHGCQECDGTGFVDCNLCDGAGEMIEEDDGS